MQCETQFYRHHMLHLLPEGTYCAILPATLPHQPGGSCTCFMQVHDYYDQEEPIQVAHAVADTCIPQQKAQDWLNGVVAENDEVKDMVLQQLWKKEDFQST